MSATLRFCGKGRKIRQGRASRYPEKEDPHMAPGRPPIRIFASALTAVLALCSDARHLSPQQSVSVTDSAGVRVVESSGPAWSAGAGWRLGTEPTLTIGAVTGDPNYLFQGISHVLRLEDGTVVVAERVARHLRFFDPAGVYIRSLGGSGEGPGEFQLLNEVWVRGDTILVSDNLQSRISVFARDGDVLETIRVEAAPGMGSRGADTQFADGMLLVLNAPTGGSRLGTGDVIPGSVWRLDRYSRSGRFMNEIAGLRASPRWEHGIEGLSPGMYLPFSVGIAPYAASGDPPVLRFRRLGPLPARDTIPRANAPVPAPPGRRATEPLGRALQALPGIGVLLVRVR